MTQLDGKTRARLPDSAFAYVDSRGHRRLPINDEAHVRNALARFNQTPPSRTKRRADGRERGCSKPPRSTASCPLGFMTGQLRSQSLQAAVLRDPTLSVPHWSDSVGAYLDGKGQAVVLPTDREDRAVTLLERYGQPMTALVHDPAVLSDPDLARTVTAKACH